MRPSLMSFSNAMRATSRRTGSKPEIITASGVSSIIKSIPVKVSRVRMLRPSRPMMRPFISSLGRPTTETVVSATWSAAQRWIAREIISRAFFSASSLACCSKSLISIADSCLTSSSKDCSSSCLASSLVKPDKRSNSACCFAHSCSALSWAAVKLCSLRASFSSLRSKDSILRSRFSSFCTKRRSWRCKSLRLSLFSRSISERRRWISSLASIIISLRFASPACSASCTIRIACSSAVAILLSATFLRTK